MRNCHFTWQICQALNMSQAEDVLAAAAKAMQTYLDNRPDPKIQAVYLCLPHHRTLWQAQIAQQAKRNMD